MLFPNLLMGEDQVFLANMNIQWNKVYKEDKNVYNYVVGNPGQLTLSRSAIKDRILMDRYLIKSPRDRKNFSFFARALRFKIKLTVLVNGFKN
jgi:hypothetical protein